MDTLYDRRLRTPFTKTLRSAVRAYEERRASMRGYLELTMCSQWIWLVSIYILVYLLVLIYILTYILIFLYIYIYIYIDLYMDLLSISIQHLNPNPDYTYFVFRHEF